MSETKEDKGRKSLAEMGSPLHFRPADGGYVGDCIPFFWQGVYHVFYLKRQAGSGTPWAHVTSRDLVHWTEEPLALALGRPDETDGGDCWTGCIFEHEGSFHLWYTGHNEALPSPQTICHATSADLTRWTKDPANPILKPDTRWYGATHFRDPYVFRHGGEGCFWMTLTAAVAPSPDDPTGGPPRAGCVGVAKSWDLVTWEQHLPVWISNRHIYPECTDLFEAAGRWFMLYSCFTSYYAIAPAPEGPWHSPPDDAIDEPHLYAIKRLFDGRRHIGFGWVASRAGETDDGAWEWGGHMGIPRELRPLRDGNLSVRPARKVVEAFRRGRDVTPEGRELRAVSGEWKVQNGAVEGAKADGWAMASVPAVPSYMLTAAVRFDGPACRASLLVRLADDGEHAGMITLDPTRSRVTYRRWTKPRDGDLEMERPVRLRRGRPTRITLFLQGTILEVFVDDQVAFAGRVYDHATGRLGLIAENGTVRFEALRLFQRDAE